MKREIIAGNMSLDSLMGMTMLLLLTSSAPVTANPTLPELLKDQDKEIVVEAVNYNYHFHNNEDDYRNHPFWFDDNTGRVSCFAAYGEDNKRFRFYNHRLSKYRQQSKRPRSITRLVWEEYKEKLNSDPLLYSLLEQVVDWVDEMVSRESEMQQSSKEMLYGILGPLALEKAGYKGVKIHTNHIYVLSYLPKFIGKMSRNFNLAENKNSLLNKALSKVVGSLGEYLSMGLRNKKQEISDWELLYDCMTVSELNPLVDLVVVNESPLPMKVLRHRLNQRYLEQTIKRNYLLIATFKNANSMRLHRQFPRGLASFSLSACKKVFLERYQLSENSVFWEANNNGLGFNELKEEPSILDETIQYCKDNFRMKIPAEQIMLYLGLVEKMSDFLAAQSSGEEGAALFSEIDALLKKNETAGIRRAV